MPSAASLPDGWPAPSFDVQAQVLTLAEQIGRIIAIAGAMVETGRKVDLLGLQTNVGLLCAKALDLPTNEARAVRLELIRLVSRLDALSAAMREPPS